MAPEHEQEDPQVRPMSVRQITLVGIVAFSLFTLLNSASLLRLVAALREHRLTATRSRVAVTVAGS